MRTVRYKNKTRQRGWLDGEYGDYLLIATLVLAFPVGLYVMWKEARWKKWIKILVSAGWACVIVLAILLPILTSMAYDRGGVDHKPMNVQTVNGRELLAPMPPEELPDTLQLYKDESEASGLISVPTPTPTPTYVYCNDNGKNYHLKGCRYVYDGKTPRVTLTQARNAGKTACKLCKPPEEETYGK